MPVFSKLKTIRDLRSQAKDMQSILKDVIIEEEYKGSKITLDGNMEVQSLTISKEQSPSELQDNLKKLLNNAIKKAQRQMAKKMQESGKMNIPGLTS